MLQQFAPINHFCSDLCQAEKVNYEKFKSWLLQNKDAFTFSRWLLSSGVCVTLTDDSDTPTFYQTLAGVTHCECSILRRHSVLWIKPGEGWYYNTIIAGKLAAKTLAWMWHRPICSIWLEGKKYLTPCMFSSFFWAVKYIFECCILSESFSILWHIS